MVTFKSVGRFGNVLFQAAATIGYALRHDLDFTVPTKTHDAKWCPIYLTHLANPKYDPTLPEVRVVERGHAYQQIPFQESWRGKNIVLDGYWQSEKYFEECREKILELFNYPWVPHKGTVSVHVRRGDYVQLAHKHPPVSVEWYNYAMEQFNGYNFRFFSDDIPYCHAHWGNHPNCSFSSGRSPEEQDLAEMSSCEHHISSASTFSWWSAWLNQNPNKRIIIPKRWFSDAEELKCNTKDIVPESWERI